MSNRQFVNWLIPLAYLLALTLAQYWFPNHFEELLQFTPLGLTLLLTRNALLLLILLLTTKHLLSSPKNPHPSTSIPS